MIHKIIQYTIIPEKTDLVITAIAEFLDGIRRNEPHTDYKAYRIKESNSFIHFMIFSDEQVEYSHRNASYTRHFDEIINPVCVTEPEIIRLEKIEGMTGGEYE